MRLAKLKEVFKRVVQEILKCEDGMEARVQAGKDSFYGDSKASTSNEGMRQFFLDIKAGFAEIFKRQIRQANLDLRLNSLDKDIKDGRIASGDIRDPVYIAEIFESSIVDRKEAFLNAVLCEIKSLEERSAEMRRRVSLLKESCEAIELENDVQEREYGSLVSRLENALGEIGQ